MRAPCLAVQCVVSIACVRQRPTPVTTNSAIPGSVRLTQALPGEAQIFENLMQLYTHDFSELWMDSY